MISRDLHDKEPHPVHVPCLDRDDERRFGELANPFAQPSRVEICADERSNARLLLIDADDHRAAFVVGEAGANLGHQISGSIGPRITVDNGPIRPATTRIFLAVERLAFHVCRPLTRLDAGNGPLDLGFSEFRCHGESCPKRR